MKQPRHKISKYIADTTMDSGITKKFSEEIAAYLLTEKITYELDSLLRDVREYWAEDGFVEVFAVSAFEISPQVKQDIKDQVSKIYPSANKIIVSERHDPSVIAGVRIELANQQLDLSVQAKLNKFKQLSVS